MGASPNPLVQGSMARQLVQRLAQGRGGAAPEAADGQLASQFSELQGADPNMLLKSAQQLKKMLVQIYVRTSFSIPEASRHAATAQKALDAMIKALEQGAATQNSVRPPIANNAALSNPAQNPGGGEPVPGGMQ